MKKKFLFILILAAGFLLSPTAPKKPDAGLIFIDDRSYGDLSCLKAMRRGNMELVFAHPGRRDEGYVPGTDGYRGENNEHFPTPPVLYALAHNPGKRYDLSPIHPPRKANLETRAEKARTDLGDALQQRTGANVRAGGIASMK